MWNRKFLIGGILLALMSLSSCTAVLDIDPREQFVVVHGVLINEPRQVIDLHYSSLLSENYMPPVDEAVVWVEEMNDDGSVRHRYDFVPVGDGRWEAEFTPDFATQYCLKVQVPGYKPIAASTIYPAAENLLMMAVSDSGYLFHSVYIPMYLWVYGLDYCTETGVHQLADYIVGRTALMVDYFDDSFSIVGIPTPIVVEDVIPHDAFNQTEVLTGNHADVKDTPFGMMHPDIPMCRYYLRYETGVRRDPELNYYFRETYQIFPSFKIQEDGQPVLGSYIVFDSLSEDYDRYLKGVLTKELNKEEIMTDFSQLYNYQEVYTNIVGGTGIFGAVYRVKQQPIPAQYTHSK